MWKSTIGFEILLILALIVVNGIFAMSEIAVVSSRKTRLHQRADAGNAGARRALELAEHPNRFLATVQIGITLVGVFAGAYGGASIAGRFGAYLEQFAPIAAYSEEIALAIVVASITFLSLVVGELVPKRIGLNHPERIAARAAALMSPRHRIEWLDVRDPIEVHREELIRHRYSHYLVCDGDLDHVRGMVRVKDLVADLLDGKPLDLNAVLRKPLFVPESLRALRLLEMFRESGTHLAVVIDEYGGAEGRTGYNTLGGFIVTQLGRIPASGDKLEAQDLRFEVMDMDGRRVDKVLVSRVGEAIGGMMDMD